MEARRGIEQGAMQRIEYPRLRAQPGALRCIDCQRIYENTHAHPVTTKL
jgi:RNA polymerase-binding transcription factor DksA